MNIQRYTACNACLVLVGVLTNITLLISLYSIVYTIRYMLANKFKAKYLKAVYSVLSFFLCLDILDLARYTLSL